MDEKAIFAYNNSTASTAKFSTRIENTNFSGEVICVFKDIFNSNDSDKSIIPYIELIIIEKKHNQEYNAIIDTISLHKEHIYDKEESHIQFDICCGTNKRYQNNELNKSIFAKHLIGHKIYVSKKELAAIQKKGTSEVYTIIKKDLFKKNKANMKTLLITQKSNN